jgi:photosystem II stability/assembly factor-like uncharacterized protein
VATARPFRARRIAAIAGLLTAMAAAALMPASQVPTAAGPSPASAAAQSPPKWRMRYFYDEEKSSFEIADLQFPSNKRGLAVGVIVQGGHQRPAEVVTADGGAHWQMIHLEEPPLSLFFLNESLGWMVTTRGLWQTTEAGRNWRKLPHLPSPVFRVCFIDERNGFAAGPKKKMYRTRDGGQHWEPVAAAAEPPGNPEFSAYTWISFATPKFGIATGWNMPPRHQESLPDWMDPESAATRRDTPHLTYSLVTNDGGATWKSQAASLFGQVARVRFGPGGLGLGLIEYPGTFRYAAEVYQIEWKTGKSHTVYRDRRFAVTDIWQMPDGTAYLAGVEAVGQVRGVMPGKVRVLRSSADLADWTEMPVDYRATASRVMLAVPDAENLWMATDAGMILKLQ